MCGITGIIKYKKLETNDIALVGRMNGKLVHRGPNSEGVWKNDHVMLAMRRLSIIDLATGSQPLFNEDGSIVLIANGEIYNFVELQKKLEVAGHTYKTKSDCESIIHAYEEYGDDFIKELRGMFAFCLYDMKKNIILIVRDRVGEKPLYLHETPDSLAFSSEMKSIIECIPEKTREIDHEGVYSYFHYGYLPEPKTLIKGIRKLPVGSMLSMDMSDPKNFSIKETAYWKYADIQKIETTEAPKKLIRDKLDDLERMIIRSDVPVGISLSGGIDSSLIAILSARYSKKNLHAFSVGYPGYPENDERRFAKKLASELKLTYHDIEITKEDFVRDFEKMIYDMDDPIADIAAYGYYRVAKGAREANVPVLLAGFGGDELFWGYSWVRTAVRYNTLKKTLAGRLCLFVLLAKENRYRLRRNFGQTLAQISRQAFSNDFIMYDITTSFNRIQRNEKEIFTPCLLATIDPKGPQRLFTDTSLIDPESGASIALDNIWLSSNCIALGDRMSMAHSIEMRLPLVDHRLVETVFGLRKATRRGSEDYRKGFKYWLIEATKDIVPEEIISRKKQGFNPPTSEWMLSIIKNRADEIEHGYAVKKNIIKKEWMTHALAEPQKNQEFLYRAVVLESWIHAYAKPAHPTHQ